MTAEELIQILSTMPPDLDIAVATNVEEGLTTGSSPSRSTRRMTTTYDVDWLYMHGNDTVPAKFVICWEPT